MEILTDDCSFTAESDWVVSVFESRMNKVHTTRTWDFLGINSVQQYKQLQMDSSSDVIVGVVDTGKALYPCNLS